ncbi:MAG TPA: hypothetical protein PLR85_16265, partial [Nitrospira sp.]|nr:hypothetical protein [Nitrospira sp.]
MDKKSLKHRLLDHFKPGFFLTKITRRADILALLQSLHPVVTEHPLIRIGPAGDGGYLVPDDLEGIKACFSPGVSTSSDFELDCAERGMQIYLADYSVDGPATQHPNFHFKKKFVGATTSEIFMTMADWVAQSGIPQEAD